MGGGMRHVTIDTHTDGPVQVTCHYVAPGGVFGITPTFKEPDRGKWTVTHIPTGRHCLGHLHAFDRIEDAKVYARALAKILGPIQSPCSITQSQVNQINRYIGRREFKPWEPGDPDYPCGAAVGTKGDRISAEPSVPVTARSAAEPDAQADHSSLST